MRLLEMKEKEEEKKKKKKKLTPCSQYFSVNACIQR